MDDESEGCPKCMSQLANVPDLVLKYSTCCGRVLCTSCIGRMYASKKVVECDQAGCGQMIGRKNFVNKTYDQQLYSKGVQTRGRIKDIFNQTRDDFDSLELYNNYLELVADVTFAMSYGSDAEKKDAQAKLQKYRQENRDKITARKLMDEDIDADGTDADANATDRAWAKMSSSGTAMRDVMNKMPEARKRTSAPQDRGNIDPELVKKSGGFKFLYDETRSSEEAESGLFFGCSALGAATTGAN
mmetsp:Transcript_13609/g.24596  ORF Transcript_13609/g.24596 Transcript_13609/m.24596 type:complete len:244 (-) Transcript_13609:106-837(-)